MEKIRITVPQNHALFSPWKRRVICLVKFPVREYNPTLILHASRLHTQRTWQGQRDLLRTLTCYRARHVKHNMDLLCNSSTVCIMQYNLTAIILRWFYMIYLMGIFSVSSSCMNNYQCHVMQNVWFIQQILHYFLPAVIKHRACHCFKTPDEMLRALFIAGAAAEVSVYWMSLQLHKQHL